MRVWPAILLFGALALIFGQPVDFSGKTISRICSIVTWWKHWISSGDNYHKWSHLVTLYNIGYNPVTPCDLITDMVTFGHSLLHLFTSDQIWSLKFWAIPSHLGDMGRR